MWHLAQGQKQAQATSTLAEMGAWNSVKAQEA